MHVKNLIEHGALKEHEGRFLMRLAFQINGSKTAMLTLLATHIPLTNEIITEARETLSENTFEWISNKIVSYFWKNQTPELSENAKVLIFLENKFAQSSQLRPNYS
jgi:tetrahydrodipicolinate N-succinyltransferase